MHFVPLNSSTQSLKSQAVTIRCCQSSLQELFVIFPARNVISCTSEKLWTALHVKKTRIPSFLLWRDISAVMYTQYDINDMSVCISNCCYGSSEVRGKTLIYTLGTLKPCEIKIMYGQQPLLDGSPTCFCSFSFVFSPGINIPVYHHNLLHC